MLNDGAPRIYLITKAGNSFVWRAYLVTRDGIVADTESRAEVFETSDEARRRVPLGCRMGPNFPGKEPDLVEWWFT